LQTGKHRRASIVRAGGEGCPPGPPESQSPLRHGRGWHRRACEAV